MTTKDNERCLNIIKARLQETLAPTTLEISNESHLHNKHEEAIKNGGGHFRLLIISSKFKDLTEIERHRLVYMALDDIMGQEIHALSIKALTS